MAAHVPSIAAPSLRTLTSLAESYSEATGGLKGSHSFQIAVETALLQTQCHCPTDTHVCDLENHFGTPNDLIEIFEQEFALHVDGTADALHKSSLPQWISGHKSDEVFG